MTFCSPTDPPHSHLARVSRAYLEQARALSYRALRTNQDAPWANIGYGAAGIATAFWRSGRDTRGSQDRLTALRWLSAAQRAGSERGAFWTPNFGSRRMGSSLYYGPDGVQFLRLLVAHDGRRASRRRSARDPKVEAFLSRARRRAGGPTVLVEGVAGTLTALVLLHRATRDARVLDVADVLAADLLSRAEGPFGWARADNLFFAHGRAGSLHALLAWSLAGERDLPACVFDHFARLAEDVERGGSMGVRSTSGTIERHALLRSWCNGAAGLVLLWARAYERTRDATFLDRARDAARFVLASSDPAPAHLCCGLGGWAYALLAMDRVEPGAGWFEQAANMAGRAVSAMVEERGQWPNGLFTGYPGLVCLARDLLSAPEERAGFPLVEGF